MAQLWPIVDLVTLLRPSCDLGHYGFPAHWPVSSSLKLFAMTLAHWVWVLHSTDILLAAYPDWGTLEAAQDSLQHTPYGARQRQRWLMWLTLNRHAHRVTAGYLERGTIWCLSPGPITSVRVLRPGGTSGEPWPLVRMLVHADHLAVLGYVEPRTVTWGYLRRLHECIEWMGAPSYHLLLVRVDESHRLLTATRAYWTLVLDLRAPADRCWFLCSRSPLIGAGTEQPGDDDLPA